MVFNVDLCKLILIIVMIAAALFGAVAWWVPVLVAGHYLAFPYQYVSPSLKRQIKEREAFAALHRQAMQANYEGSKNGRGNA